MAIHNPGGGETVLGGQVNDGRIILDDFAQGGSSLAVDGTLTNAGNFSVGNGALSASTTATAAGLSNSGILALNGNGPNQATLNIAAAAPATWTGTVNLADNALLQFASGGITSIAGGAQINENGTHSRIAIASDPASNSALTGLANNAGQLFLGNGATLTTSTDLANTGTLLLDDYAAGGGAASLSLAGTLSSAGSVAVATAAAGLASSTGGSLLLSGGTLSLAAGSVQVNGLKLGAGISLSGNGTVSSAVADDGTIDAQGGVLDVTGAVTGNGHLAIEAAATLELGGTSATGAGPGTYSAMTNSTSLLVSLAGGGTLSFTLAGNYVGDTFNTTQHGTDNFVTLGGVANVPPSLVLPLAHLVQQTVTTAISGLSVADGDAVSANETITVTLTAAGALSATTGAAGGGGTITGSGTGTLDVAGSLAQVNADLSTLTLTESGTAADTIEVSANDGRGGSAGPSGIAITVNAPPAITAPTSATAEQGVATAISSVSIADSDAVAAGESITVTLTDSHGTLAVTPSGGTVSGNDTASLTLVGSLAPVNAELGTLTDTASQAGPATIAIAVDDGRGGQDSRSIAVTAGGNAPPVLTVPGGQSATINAAAAIAGVSVADADALSAGETITVALSDAAGQLSATTGVSGGGGTIAGSGTNHLTITGTLGQVDADLTTLAFQSSTPGADSIDVAANDGRGGSDDKQVAVTVGANAPPVLSAPGALVASIGFASQLLGVSVSDADAVSAGETITVTVTAGHGALQANTGAAGGGGSITGTRSGDLVIAGSLAQVNADLSTLTYQASAVGTDAVGITASDGTTTTSAQQLRVLASTPAEFVIDPRIGTLSRSGTNYTLDLGVIASGASLPTLTIGILNTLLDPVATLSGTVSNADSGGFSVLGTGAFAGVAAGSQYRAVQVNLNTATPGYYTETLTLDPVLTPSGGVTSAPETLTIDVLVAQPGLALNPGDETTGPSAGPDTSTTILPGGTVVFPDGTSDTIDLPGGNVYFPGGLGRVTLFNTSGKSGSTGGGGHGGRLTGDVHLLTFDGLYYDFQAVGEFVAARSTVPGDTFAVQVRTRPYHNNSTASVISQAAAGVGSHRVTVDADRTNPLFVDGAVVALSAADPTLNLGSGRVTLVAPGSYQIDWTTGESATFTVQNGYVDVTVSPGSAAAGSFAGLLGPDDGNAATDLRLADGTVLSQPLGFSTLYGSFADSWRVTQVAGQTNTSILDYGAGETTATFTDTNFPPGVLDVGSLPADVLARATALVNAAGISDPGLRNAAIYDYAVTGDTSFVTSEQEAAQQGATTVQQAQVVNAPTPSEVGVSPLAAKVLEAASGPTAIVFEAYRTVNTTGAVTVDYQVIAAGAGYADASSFGGTLPSGQVVIPDGQASAQFTIDVPGGFSASDEKVRVQVSDENGLAVAAPTADTTVTNNHPTAGSPAAVGFAQIAGAGALTHVGNAWTLDLGQVTQGTALATLQLLVVNEAAAPADLLSGRFDVSGDGSMTVSGATPFANIAAGATQGGLNIQVNTLALGPHSTTLTLHGVDSNDSGYSAALPDTTLTIVENGTAPAQPIVFAPAAASLSTGPSLALGPVHVGADDTVAVSVGNVAAAPAESLDASIGALSGNAVATGSVTRLAAGQTDSTDLRAGVSAATAGAKTGTVTIALASDGQGTSGNGVTPLTADAIQVSGSVYRLAAAQVTPASIVVHVGDAGTAGLQVANTDPADGFSEALSAQLGNATGTIGLVAAGNTGAIAAGTASNALALSFSTAQSGTGTATLALTSDGGTGAGSIDGLGTTALAAQTVTVTVDNHADPVFEELSGGGTISRSGNAFTLDLGTLAQGSGLRTVGLGVLNQATGLADTLSGTLGASGTGAVSAQGLAAFAGLAAGAADTAPAVTIDTTNAGQFTETVTLDAIGSNASGYAQAFAPETLIITGTIAALPPPQITAPTAATIIAGPAAMLGTISIADVNAGAAPLTVTITATSGRLSAAKAGSATVTGTDTNQLVLSGSLADIDAVLASLTVTEASAGADTVSLSVRDATGALASATVAVTTLPVPVTKPIIDVPAAEVVVPDQQNGIGRFSIVDPYAQATGQTVTLHVSSTGTAPVTYPASGQSGATVTGQGTGTLTVSGTVDQVNNYLSDGITEEILHDAYQKALIDAEKAGEEVEEYLKGYDLFTAFVSEGLVGVGNELLGQIKGDIAGQLGIPQLPSSSDIVKTFIQADVGLFSFAANVLGDVAAIAAGATSFPPPEGGGGGMPHLITFDGLSYQMEAAGDFLLASSTASGNSFEVQIRLEPAGTSTAASEITQLAAVLGTDRVTIGANRAAPVWINGTPTTLAVGTPVHLNGGEITEIASGTYRIDWNTGESVTVTEEGTFLNVNVGLGANETAGSIVGLLGGNTGQANDFALPDGTVLPEPLTSDTLKIFINAWRLPEPLSSLDYAPGQTNATVNNPNFPAISVSLADLPADVVAQVAQAVAGYGITDPGAVAAAEFDYIASGGDPSVIAADQSLFQGLTTTAVTVTPSSPTPAVLGVMAAQSEVAVNQSGSTTVTLKVYLTKPEPSDTVVQWAAIASGAADLAAARSAAPSPRASSRSAPARPAPPSRSKCRKARSAAQPPATCISESPRTAACRCSPAPRRRRSPRPSLARRRRPSSRNSQSSAPSSTTAAITTRSTSAPCSMARRCRPSSSRSRTPRPRRAISSAAPSRSTRSKASPSPAPTCRARSRQGRAMTASISPSTRSSSDRTSRRSCSTRSTPTPAAIPRRCPTSR